MTVRKGVAITEPPPEDDEDRYLSRSKPVPWESPLPGARCNSRPVSSLILPPSSFSSSPFHGPARHPNGYRPDVTWETADVADDADSREGSFGHEGLGGGREAQMPPALSRPALPVGLSQPLPLARDRLECPCARRERRHVPRPDHQRCRLGRLRSPSPRRRAEVATDQYATWTLGDSSTRCVPIACPSRVETAAMNDGPFPGS
jgi:hypothetical protein